MTDKKPIVKINNYSFNSRGDCFILSGNVENHPRFEKDELVITSKIIRVETKNTIYDLGETND